MIIWPLQKFRPTLSEFCQTWNVGPIFARNLKDFFVWRCRAKIVRNSLRIFARKCKIFFRMFSDEIVRKSCTNFARFWKIFVRQCRAKIVQISCTIFARFWTIFVWQCRTKIFRNSLQISARIWTNLQDFFSVNFGRKSTKNLANFFLKKFKNCCRSFSGKNLSEILLLKMSPGVGSVIFLALKTKRWATSSCSIV